MAFHTGEEKGLLGAKYLTENSDFIDDAIVVLENIVRHVEYVPEVATEPNYDPAIAAVKESL